MHRLTLLLASLAAIQFTTALAETSAEAHWPNWRGPSLNGSSTATNLPSHFSKEDKVRWIANLEGQGASVPIVWGDKIFITSAITGSEGISGKGTLKALCIDRVNGEPLWEHSLESRTHVDERSNFASPSAVTDGEKVVFSFGSGDLIAFDFEGNELWNHNLLGNPADDAFHYFACQWTFSSSPLLHEERLYLQVLQRDVSFEQNGTQRGRPEGDNPSYLLCLDLNDGSEIWRQDRPSNARMESLESFSTPLVHTIEGAEHLIITGGDCVTGHNPATGAELWRWGTWNPDREPWWRLVPSPVATENTVIIPAPKKSPVYAVKLGGSGDLGTDGLAWKSDPDLATSDVSTPAIANGKLYLVDGDRKERALVCMNPETGDIHWRGLLDSKAKIEASPTVADGKVFIVDHDGKVFVAKADGEEFELIHQTELGERDDDPARSPVVTTNGELLIRIGNRLYCIGNENVAQN